MARGAGGTSGVAAAVWALVLVGCGSGCRSAECAVRLVCVHACVEVVAARGAAPEEWRRSSERGASKWCYRGVSWVKGWMVCQT